MQIQKQTQRLLCMMGIAMVAKSSTFAGMDMTASPTSPCVWQKLTFDSWWNGSNALAGWGGLAPLMKDYGLTITGSAWQGYYGNVTGGFPNQQRSNWLNEEKLRFIYDFNPIFGIQGLTFESYWRYRNAGNNPAYQAGTVGPSAIFNPTSEALGLGVRILQQQLQWSNNTVMVNLGWENPWEQFLQQPLSKYFENQAITTAKGIGGLAGAGIAVVNPDIASSGGSPGVGNPTKGGVRFYATSPVPWNPNYDAWGGTLKVKPSHDTYLMSGLYESIAGANGIPATQFTATSVYPYTSVPASYLGQFKSSGEIVPVVGANGQIIPGAMQNLGWVAAYQNNHGFNFQGAPGMSTPAAYVAVVPTTSTGGKIFGTSTGAGTYKNSNGQYVTSPGLYAASPYNQGGIGGGYSQNGLYNVNEIGWTPKFGADKLEGHYALGGYIWGQPNTDFTPTRYTVSVFNPKTGVVAYTSYGATKANPYQENQLIYGLYLQADQMLYRVHEKQEATSDSKNHASAPKNFSDKGLYEFSECTFTPPQNNALPFYFQTGLVYKGLIPHRDKDSLGIALGAGFYSSYYNNYIQAQNQQMENAVGSAYNATVPNGPTQTGSVNATTGKVATGKTTADPLTDFYQYAPNFSSTEVIEAFYNIQINQWASVKPYVQYIINPAGNGTLANDCVLGVTAKIVF